MGGKLAQGPPLGQARELDVGVGKWAILITQDAMASDYDKISDLNKPVRRNRPLFERLQDLVFKLDSGFGVQWFRVGLFLLAVLLVILLYTGTQFYGLRSRETMDLGQLGRNLALGRGYVTKNIRPIDLAYLGAIGKPSLSQGHEVIPELWTPPMYPLILSVWFQVVTPQARIGLVKQRLQIPAQQLPADLSKLQSLYEGARGETLRQDRFMVILAWVFFIADLGLVFWLARELFDRRVALMSVVLCLLCDPLLEACVDGGMLPFLALLVLGLIWLLLKAQLWAESKSSVYWVAGALVAIGALTGVAILTRYTMICLLVPLAVLLKVSMQKVHWRVKFGFCFGTVLLVVLPWVAHNTAVAESPFGLARWAVTRIAADDRGEALARLELERQFVLPEAVHWRRVVVRALTNWKKLYRETVKDTGASYLIAFFLVALLHRFRRDEALRLHWFVVGVLLTVVIWLGLAGPPAKNFLTVFVPIIAIYSAAFFFVMFERLQFRKRWARRGIVGIFVGVNVLPAFLTLLPPRPLTPYPPYDGGVVAAISETFNAGDLLASDIPWAVAWYGDRSTVLIPVEEKTYMELLNDKLHIVSGIYLTTWREWHLDAPTVHNFWFSKYDFGHPPSNSFPLKYRRQLTPDGDQVLWSDRPR